MSRIPRAWRPFLVGAFITVLLIVVRIGFGMTEPDRFEGLNDQLADSLWIIRNHFGRGPTYPNAAEHLVVVLIDVPSLRESPEAWPWTPGTFAEFINMTLDVGQAKGVLLDVPFRGLTNEDRQVRQALARPGVVYGAQAYNDENNKMVIEAPLARPTVEGDAYATQTFGMTAVYTGNDKVVRDVLLNLPMRVLEPGSDKQEVVFVTALCLQAAAEVMNAPRSEIEPLEDEIKLHPRSAHGHEEQPFTIPLYKGRFVVNYSFSDHQPPMGSRVAPGVYSFVPTVSYLELMQMSAEQLRERLEGRFLLVGLANPFIKPYVATPFGAEVPGIYVEAECVASIFEQDFVSRSYLIDEVVLILVLGLLISGVVTRLGQARGIGITLLALAVWYVICLATFLQSQLILPILGPWVALLIPAASVSAFLNRVDEEEKAQIRQLFGGYLSPKVVDSLLRKKYRGELGLTGRKLKLTVFYSDIRGFTAMSERLDPLEVVSLLNEHFECLTRVAYRHDAYIDKFVGDSLMAVLSAPTPRPDDSLRAVTMALEMREEIRLLVHRRESRGEPVYQIGIGIHTDRVVLGNIGSSVKMDYTVIGDGVNLTSRLCDAAQGDQILISQATYDEVKEYVEVRPLEPIRVKGKAEPVGIYEVLGKKT